MTRRPPKSTLFPSTPLFRSSLPPSCWQSVSQWSASWVGSGGAIRDPRSEKHTTELQSRLQLIYPLFFFNDTAPPEIYPLSLHAALPIFPTPLLLAVCLAVERLMGRVRRRDKGP